VPESALVGYPCLLISTTYQALSHFHGDNTGSNPVGDANYFSNLRASIIFSYVRFVPITVEPVSVAFSSSNMHARRLCALRFTSVRAWACRFIVTRLQACRKGWVNGDTAAVLTTAPTCATTYTTTSANSSYPTTCSGAVAANYSISYVSGSVAVGLASQTITFTAPTTPVIYGASSVGLSATASSGLAVSFTASGACSVSGSTLSYTSAGTCTVTANQAGNSNYAAATPVSYTVTVNSASNPTPSIGSLSPDYTSAGGKAFTLTVNGSGFVSNSTVYCCHHYFVHNPQGNLSDYCGLYGDRIGSNFRGDLPAGFSASAAVAAQKDEDKWHLADVLPCRGDTCRGNVGDRMRRQFQIRNANNQFRRCQSDSSIDVVQEYRMNVSMLF
jgi:hypothetical protein